MRETPTAFTSRVLASVRHLLDARPAGFRHADIAARLGAEFAADGEHVRRLRRTLARLRAEGMLEPGGHGVFRAGEKLADAEALAPGVGLLDRTERFLAESGGFGQVREIRDALALDASEARALFRVLETGRFEQLPPLINRRWYWALPRDELTRTPLPGWRLRPGLALERMLAGETAQRWRSVGIGDVNSLRRDIGRSVRTARERMGLEEYDLLDGVVRAEFERCLEAGRSWVFHDGEAILFSDWWRRRVINFGRDDAVEVAWVQFEHGQALGEPAAVDTLDARFWRALGASLDTDAAALSKGRLASG